MTSVWYKTTGFFFFLHELSYDWQFSSFLIYFLIGVLLYNVLGLCCNTIQISHNETYITSLVSPLTSLHPAILGHHKIPHWVPSFTVTFHQLPVTCREGMETHIQNKLENTVREGENEMSGRQQDYHNYCNKLLE